MVDSQVIFNKTDIVFWGNLASTHGGALYIKQTSVITTASNLIFVDNIAETGGAVCIFNNTGNGKLTVLSGEFANNTGGGVYAIYAQITFTDINMTS